MEANLTMSGGPELAKLKPIDLHRHIKYETSEIELRPDGTIRSVHVLYTDLELSRSSSNYDPNAVEQLVIKIQAYQKNHRETIRLRTMP